MTHRNLVYFKTVADMGSISKAAESLFVAQPSLSQTIKRIEEDVGTPLFRRTPAGLVLTFAGERYYWTVSQILRLYENFQNDINDLERLQSGRLTIGTTNPLGVFILPRVLPAFHRLHPQIQLDVTEANTRQMEDKLRQGAVDIALLHQRAQDKDENLDYHMQISLPFVVVTAQGTALASKSTPDPNYEFPLLDLRELSGVPMLMAHRSQRAQQIAEKALQRAGILHPCRALTIRSYDTIHNLAAAGMGTAILPREYIRPVEKDLFPCYFSIPAVYGACWDLCVVSAKNSAITRAASAFARLLEEEIQTAFLSKICERQDDA